MKERETMKETCVMDVHVEHSEKRIGITLDAIGFYRCADGRLAQDEFGQVVGVEQVGICLEELAEETFECLVVNGGIWIKEIEIDVNEALLG